MPIAPGATLLSNGRYVVLITAAGAGYSALGRYALTRWAPDPTRDVGGLSVYVRDLDGGAFWSAGEQPVRRPARRYGAALAETGARFARADGEVETRLEVCVAPDDDAELRRLTLANHGARPRRLEVTTYAELVLNTPAADAAHPAFSKLFVQTGYLAEAQGLLAWRRPRSPEDEPLWVVHLLEPAEGVSANGIECETDRARFLGRGRSPADPAALRAGGSLSGTVGNVLDPVASLRRVVTLAPGAVARLTAVLGAGRTREAVVALAARFRDPAAVESAFRAARPAGGALETLGLPAEWARAVGQMLGGSAPGDRPAPLGASALGGSAREGGHPLPWGAPPEFHDGTSGAKRPHRSSAAGIESARSAASPAAEPLLLFNGSGGFARDGSEYVVRVAHTPDGPRWPPLPWSNVVANEDAGFIVTESGAGNTWTVNSREHRLTPWSNDPVSDPHEEALYIRDEEAGAVWSPTPGPAPAAADYEVRHGLGYTSFRHTSAELEQEVWQFVPRRGPVKIVRVRLTNLADRARRVSVVAYARWVLGGLPQETARFVVTAYDAELGAVLASNPAAGEFAHRVAFAAAAAPSGGSVSVTADRAAFLGRYGSAASPAALASGAPLDGRTGAGLDPCAALRVPVALAPGGSAECVVLLGDAESEDEARHLVRQYANANAASRALDEVRAFWRETVGGVRVETPSPAIDLMVNGWLPYQNLSCRVWGRSAFYQSGGAFGFRDQLQDAAALVYLAPELTRAQIVLHAAHQFVEGDVMHWWHPPLSKGIRTRFSDDLLWLPYVTAFYARTTGDASVWDEEARFLTARALAPSEDEVFLIPEDSGERATVYEHCCRAVDRSLTRGAHGLPLMGTGDWNDGMNRVGREGRGESVWLGFFVYDILGDVIPVCERRGDAARAKRYRAYRTGLAAALNDAGWDGAWYRRAFYDDGTPLGSAQNDECRIDTIAQAWAVLSRAAPRERAERAMDAMEAQLVSEREGIIRLLTPAFDRTPHDPGYIKGYLPGVRENGGQYTHGALWGVRALAELGRCERAAPLLEMLSPISHARTPDETAVYQTEPYVIAADVYGVAPHVGRGGWTWYTGSAGWMYRVALESVLGVTVREGRTLALRPCIPAAWPGFTLRYRVPGSRSAYEIVVRRDAGATTASIDGRPAAVEGGAVLVPLARDDAAHRVEVALGADAGPRYESDAGELKGGE